MTHQAHVVDSQFGETLPPLKFEWDTAKLPEIVAATEPFGSVRAIAEVAFAARNVLAVAAVDLAIPHAWGLCHLPLAATTRMGEVV